jgi:ABC-2 type transport system permease protein
MRRVAAIVRRELGAYFHSPVATVVLTVFLAVSGYLIQSVVGYYSLVSAREIDASIPDPAVNRVEGIARPYFSNLAVILMFFLPLVSMRLFAEEMRSGTMELLFSYPVRDGEAVVGKFLAAMILVAIALSGILLQGVFIAPAARPDAGAVACGLAGLLLMGSAFLAIGLFASCCTSSQVVAAALVFGALVTFFVIEWAAPLAGPGVGAVLARLSLMQHFGDFAKGVVDLEDVAFFLAVIVFFLAAAARVVALRRTGRGR